MIDHAMQKMTCRISEILCDREPTVYLYGSAVHGDYRHGWSDIDIFVLTKTTMTQEEADELLMLRQTMMMEENDPIYRCFEGGILTLSAFVEKSSDRVVYWGTSGERICGTFSLNGFSMLELIEDGVLLHGENVKEYLQKPTYHELKSNVENHLETIRKYAVKTGRSLYSFGWLFDIARCIYTLRTGEIIAKTAAGEWALREGICPVKDTLELALTVRRDPEKYIHDDKILDIAENLGGDVQIFADVLETEVKIMEKLK